MSLHSKTIHELRSIASGMGVEYGFGDDVNAIAQKIEQRQADMQPVIAPVPPAPEYDARLADAKPVRKSDEALVRELLQPHIALGLHLSFPTPETWHIAFGRKEDSGSIRIPPKAILRCAERVMS
jgi:hypothetical protein